MIQKIEDGETYTLGLRIDLENEHSGTAWSFKIVRPDGELEEVSCVDIDIQNTELRELRIIVYNNIVNVTYSGECF